MEIKCRYIAVIMFILCILIFCSRDGVKKSPHMAMGKTSPDAAISFAVLGDVHGDESGLKTAIKDLHSINPNMDVLILNGDIVDQGIESEYASISRCLEKQNGKLPGIVIKNIGNHEFYDYSKGVNDEAAAGQFIERFLAFSNESSVYHDLWLKGYHFISLGSEISHTRELGTTMAYISDIQLKWLNNRLCEGYQNGKPIFVFLHQPLTINLLSSNRKWSGIKQGDELMSILSKYPEVILFTSHTHSSFQYANLYSTEPYTSVHTGAIHNVLVPDGTGGRSVSGYSQGLYVEVLENRVIIHGREFTNKSWISDYNIEF